MNWLKTNPGKKWRQWHKLHEYMHTTYVRLLYMLSILFFTAWDFVSKMLNNLEEEKFLPSIQLKQIEKLLNSTSRKRKAGKRKEQWKTRWKHTKTEVYVEHFGWVHLSFTFFSERISGCAVKRMNATENFKRSPKIQTHTSALVQIWAWAQSQRSIDTQVPFNWFLV